MSAPSDTGGAIARLTDVVRAFRHLETDHPGLTVDAGRTLTPAGDLMDPDRGVDIRLESPREDAVVVLRLMRSGARLRSLTTTRPDASVASVIEDHLNVHLDDDYRWGHVVFSAADDLASTLLHNMERRLVSVRDVGPMRPGTAQGPRWGRNRSWPVAVLR
jgi:hypothetical protein